MKDGKNTTELKLTVIFDLLAIGLTVLGALEPELMVKVMAGMTGLYTVSRTVVKLTATKVDDAIVEKLKILLDKNK